MEFKNWSNIVWSLKGEAHEYHFQVEAGAPIQEIMEAVNTLQSVVQKAIAKYVEEKKKNKEEEKQESKDGVRDESNI